MLPTKSDSVPGVQQACNYIPERERETEYLFHGIVNLGTRWYSTNQAHPTRLFEPFLIHRNSELVTKSVT